MCFSIPLKVIKVRKNTALIEGGKVVRIGSDVKVKSGDYVRIAGDIVVGSLSDTEGRKVRSLVHSIYVQHN